MRTSLSSIWSIHVLICDIIIRLSKKVKSIAQDFVKDTIRVFCPAPVQEMTGPELDFRCHLENACEGADHTVCFRYPDKSGTPDGRPLPETLASRNFAAFYQSLTKDELDRGKPEYLLPGPTCHLHTLYAQKVNEYNGWQVVAAKQSTAYVGLFEVPFACARMRRDIESHYSAYEVDTAITGTCKTIEAPAEADAQPGANLYDWLRLLFLFLRDNRSLIQANLNTLALVIIAVCLVKICLRD